ncbi:hypothetical protein HOLleu_07325 [Holothuria leucospilota]|uniref:Uncharacterized protein n=1 Tax=Holothuria leucospilota TaxID=206669 RepID=A0A9Q1CGK2_HOLLE|nr:hypothetical protein HOLleu_07325 [Holothuria leucospilota]
MTLYMPPLAKKRHVSGKFSPDTRRVFGKIEGGQNFVTQYKSTHSEPAQRRSQNEHLKPQGVGFLLQNCRTLHEPVCNVRTKNVKNSSNDSNWWPSPTSTEEKQKLPKHSCNTTNRGDYIRHNAVPPLATRHSSNPNCYPSRGIVPVTRLPSDRGPRLLVEHISYQHQYNSRTTPSLPIRGKLHGSFVWDVLHPVSETSS